MSPSRHISCDKKVCTYVLQFGMWNRSTFGLVPEADISLIKALFFCDTKCVSNGKYGLGPNKLSRFQRYTTKRHHLVPRPHPISQN